MAEVAQGERASPEGKVRRTEFGSAAIFIFTPSIPKGSYSFSCLRWTRKASCLWCDSAQQPMGNTIHFILSHLSGSLQHGYPATYHNLSVDGFRQIVFAGVTAVRYALVNDYSDVHLQPLAPSMNIVNECKYIN
ncbi:MAG: hypothetical protein ACFWUL_01615 [Dialister sp.]